MRSRLLIDLLASVFERRQPGRPETEEGSLESLVATLLSERGEISGTRAAASILDRYEALDDTGKRRFFRWLVGAHDIDAASLGEAVRDYQTVRNGDTLRLLLQLAEPRRQEILRRLNRLDGATARLVRMRADLLRLAPDEADLQRADLDFQHLFKSWFNRGFLVLRRIDWGTPAHILERIIEYEAVHAIGSWEELRRRLQPADRLCFAFFHPAMPDDPLIFVEVALTRSMPVSIQDLLAGNREVIDGHDATHAVFYSISNCQRGLAGISFGNFLIKQVVAEIGATLPNLDIYATLSPMPGFAEWLRTQDAGIHTPTATAQADSAADVPLDAGGLRAAAIRYLVGARRNDGFPVDPVARFHLGNGAMLEQVYAGADLTPRGMAGSYGVMASYRYDLAAVDRNHERYSRDKQVAVSRNLKAALKAGRLRTA